MSGGIKGIVQAGFDILTTSVNAVTGKILAQIGNAVGQTVDSDSAEWWQSVGFTSRPSKPEAGKQAAQAVVLRKGDHDICIASQDLRGLELYGKLDHGETAIYAPGPDGTAQARVLLKKDGSINLYTTSDNTADGDSVYARVAPDGFLFNAPWGTIRWDDTGFHILHSSGASFDVGGIYGLPSPLDQIASYVKMQAGTINMSSSSTSNGLAGTFPLANATAVQVAITGLQAQITAMAAVIDAMPKGTLAPVVAAVPAIAAGTATVAGTATLIPTNMSAIPG